MSVVETFAIRVKAGQFTGQDLTVTVPGGLVANWCAEVVPGTNSTSAQASQANEAFCHISGDPFGNFGTTTAAGTIQLTRDDASPSSDLEVTILGMRCTDTGDASGFTLRGVFELTLAAAATTASSAHSGVVDTGQLQVISGGSRCASTSAFQRSCGQPRLRHTATDVEAHRTRSDTQTIVSAFLIEWGSDVTVELVELDEASITTGNDLDTTGEWTTVAIASTDASTAFVTATYTSAGSTTPSKAPTSVVTVLGDGVTLPTGATSTVAVGVQTGGHAVKGYIYVVSDPNWSAVRSRFAHGVLVGNGVTDTTFSLTTPSGSEAYTDTAASQTTNGTRLVRFHASCESEFTSEFRLAQFAVIPTDDTTASYHRQIADKSDPYGDGLAIVEEIDFGGSPFGDPNDISGSNSTAVLSQSHSIVADGIDETTLTVSVKDSANKQVPSVSVVIQVGSAPTQEATTDSNGVATFTITSEVSGTLPIRVVMGESKISVGTLPLCIFVNPPTNWGKRFGINLGKTQDFTSPAPFIDLILSGRGGEVIPRGGGSHQQAKEDFDSDGWQQSCGTSDSVVYYVATNLAKDLPNGKYIVTYTPGTWTGFDTSQVDFIGGTITSHTAGRMEVDVTWGASTTVGPRIDPTSAAMTSADYVKDFQMVHEDDESTYDRSVNLWAPKFLASITPFSLFRFMDWGQTNFSFITDWADRPLTTTQSAGRWLYDLDFPTTKRQLGMPYEWMIDLCNRTNTDAWVCIPHRATDAFVTSLATLFRDNMKAGLMTYFEYTNEAWNPTFGPQHGYRDDLRIGYGLSDTSDNKHRAYATRSAECMKLVDAVYGSNLQYRRRVISGQSGNPSVATTIVGTDVSVGTSLTGFAYDYMDFYGVAPYVGNNVDEVLAADSLSEMITDMEDSVMTAETGELALNVANVAALSTRVKLIGYEGGQHVTQGSYLDMNELPGMRGFQKDWLDYWDARTGFQPVCPFSHMFEPSGSGAWGLLQGVADHTLPPGPTNYKWYGWNDWKNSLSQMTLLPANNAVLQSQRLSLAAHTRADHAVPSFSKSGTGTALVVYHSGVTNKSIHAVGLQPRRSRTDKLLGYSQVSDAIDIAVPNDTFGADNDNCSHPWVCSLGGSGFLVCWTRHDLSATGEGAVSAQIEGCRVEVGKSGLTVSATQVFEAGIVAGDSGSLVRCAHIRGDDAILAYPVETARDISGDPNLRTYTLKYAMLNWAQGASSTGSVTSGTFTGIQMDDTDANPFATSKTILPHMVVDRDYNPVIAWEEYDSVADGVDAGKIQLRRITGPFDATPGTVLNTMEFETGSNRPARRPMLAATHPSTESLSSANEVFLTFGDQGPATPNTSVALLKKISFATATPVVTDILWPSNTETDGVTLLAVGKSTVASIGGDVLAMAAADTEKGQDFMVVDAAGVSKRFTSFSIAKPSRPAMDYHYDRVYQETSLLVTYEGDDDGVANDSAVYVDTLVS